MTTPSARHESGGLSFQEAFVIDGKNCNKVLYTVLMNCTLQSSELILNIEINV